MRRAAAGDGAGQAMTQPAHAIPEGHASRPARERAVRRWFLYLDEPVDAASLAVFRIVFGLLVAIDALRFLAYGWVDEYYVRPVVHFTYLFFDFVKPWPGAWMHAHFWAIAALGVLVALGLFYRIAIVLLFAAYTYVFLLEKSVYMNHYYLIALLAFLLCWMPAERAFSFDAQWRARAGSVPRWTVLILRAQLFIVYFYGAVAKLNADWLRGEPMYSLIVKGGPDVPEIARLLPPALLAGAIAYAGILIDFSVPVLLSARRTRRIGFVLATAFHALNAAFLRIGVFSYLMTGAITIFFAPGWPRAALARLGSRAARRLDASPATHRAGLTLLHLYLLLQLLVPLRHLAYPGPVSWTEEGHRFAWHMKLRQKESQLTIRARDPASGRSWIIDPAEDLTARQLRKLHTFPDILLQYVHYKRDQLRAAGVEPVITADWQCALNGRPRQPLVDPDANLAAVERSLLPAPWILPLRDRDAPASPVSQQYHSE